MKIIPSDGAVYVMNAANVLPPMKDRDDSVDCHKKDNNRETYDRSKIEAGVLRACHKRPVSANQITRLVDEVETDVFNMEEKEIPSQVIGELVMDRLKSLDAVAYVRFASVYREFKDINTFMDELKKVMSTKN